MINGRILMTALAIVCAAGALTAQDPPDRGKAGGRGFQMLQFDADKAIMIDEAGMVVTEKEGKLTVEFIMPKDRRPKATSGLDIAAGDEVGMAAGKKVSTIGGLRAAYQASKPGEEFTMGLRREGKAYIVSFTRLDEKDLPKRTVIRGGGDDPNRDVFPGIGIAIGLKDGRVVILETFPNASGGMSSGDIILSLNGKDVKNLKDFTGAYDAVREGGELRLGILRGGKAITVVSKRQAPPGRMIIK